MKIKLVLEKITLLELENKNHIIGIFIDLSKAFDTISHDKLLDKLNKGERLANLEKLSTKTNTANKIQ